ncbi:glycosyltransferase [Aeromicrobium sp. UC242_57]|uniref:glycosyltransferase n=1 Tax=Aeromicrobium sp. UC242_57 TaxID=3374624 RepID=UPI0037B06E67
MAAPSLLRDSFGSDRITYAPSGTGFGEAVRRGVAELPRTDWIWLLHDDASVLPGTLAGLLDTATSAPDIAAVGPKIREWPSLRRLLEVGLTVTATGTRETGLETGEPDAGQHDRPRDVLAVNTAGILIRRDVWDELDGFDPQLPLYFDDIDFGWRLARAGYRTVTAPSAIIFHAESSRRGQRPPPLATCRAGRNAGRRSTPRWSTRRCPGSGGSSSDCSSARCSGSSRRSSARTPRPRATSCWRCARRTCTPSGWPVRDVIAPARRGVRTARSARSSPLSGCRTSTVSTCSGTPSPRW